MRGETSYSELAAQVTRLERQNRWLMVGLAVVAAFVVFAAATPQEADTITAQRFVLVDSSGTEMGRWYVKEDGNPTLRLVDEKGDNQTEVSGRYLELVDSDESSPGGASSFLAPSHLTIQRGPDNLLSLVADPASLAGTVVGPRITLHAREYGEVAIGRVKLQTTRTDSVEVRPASSIVILDKDGEVIWMAPR